MFANGGEGGSCVTTSGVLGNGAFTPPVLAEGGEGGSSGGSGTILYCSGGAGTDAYGGPPGGTATIPSVITNGLGYIFGGIGGGAGHASGSTIQNTWGFEGPPVSLSGEDGQIYGGGGSGAVIGDQVSETQSGGDGAGAHLVILAFA